MGSRSNALVELSKICKLTLPLARPRSTFHRGHAHKIEFMRSTVDACEWPNEPWPTKGYTPQPEILAKV